MGIEGWPRIQSLGATVVPSLLPVWPQVFDPMNKGWTVSEKREEQFSNCYVKTDKK